MALDVCFSLSTQEERNRGQKSQQLSTALNGGREKHFQLVSPNYASWHISCLISCLLKSDRQIRPACSRDPRLTCPDTWQTGYPRTLVLDLGPTCQTFAHCIYIGLLHNNPQENVRSTIGNSLSAQSPPIKGFLAILRDSSLRRGNLYKKRRERARSSASVGDNLCQHCCCNRMLHTSAFYRFYVYIQGHCSFDRGERGLVG